MVAQGAGRAGVPALNATAAAVLGLLHDGPQTGGELVAGARERFGVFFSVTRSQVYRELPGLADAGFARLGKKGPRSSQQYVITAAGKRAFKQWLQSEPGPDHLRSPMLLRLLYAHTLTAKQREALLTSTRERYTSEQRSARAAVRAAADPHAEAIAEFRLAYARAVLRLVGSVAGA
jgi:DNA-binding PadR family transcriptional regulator